MTEANAEHRRSRPKRRGPGRPTSVSKEQIGAAVVSIGFEHLTFGAVAQELGIGEATIFRQVKDRSELVVLGLEHVMREFPWPTMEGPWRSVLSAWAEAAWDAWEQHPGSASIVTAGSFPPTMASLFTDLSKALIKQGFSTFTAICTVDSVFDTVLASRHYVEHVHTDEFEQFAAECASHDGEDPVTADIHATLATRVIGNPREYMRQKIALILDGAEAQHASNG